ncbi:MULTISPECIES: DUF927 domain-containing protein [unclassified Exiguobacterium]|uniref:DUF927 domain-containing protein n=1 Tax=unclassified Exiguobacterium TaxID=2644629 RepID=UPI0025BC72C8|nr:MULTISPECIES: DUF927 domain-containing protein [unclassified Exiguobacterium]
MKNSSEEATLVVESKLNYVQIFEEGNHELASNDGPEFVLDSNGVYSMYYDKKEKTFNRSPKRLCTPLYVVNVKRNSTEGDLMVRIAYRLHEEWFETEISSSEINEGIAAKLTKLGVGVNLALGNKPQLAHYIMLLMSEMSFQAIHNHIGFRSERKTHEIDSSILFNHYNQEYERKSDGTVLVRESDVSSTYELALRPKGDIESLVTSLQPLLKHNEIKFALGIGYSSMLHGYLKLFKPDLLNYIIHFHGNSSTGKTTAARLAVSVSGNPFESPLKAAWNWTLNALLKVIENNYGLAVLFDESSMASRDASEFIYQFSDGEERGRLNRNAGQRERSNFATICVSTGEQSLKNLDRRGRNVQNAGLSVRAIEVTDVSFMPSREVAEDIAKLVQQHHGLLGPVFAEKLLNYHPEKIMKMWEGIRSEYEQEVGIQSNYVNRLSPMFATLELAINLAYKSGLGSYGEAERSEFRNFLLEVFKSQLDSINLSDTAYAELKNYIVKNIRKFKYLDYLPSGPQTFGKVVKQGPYQNDEVFILKDVMESFLREKGYTSPRIVLKEWREKKLIKAEEDRLTARAKGLSNHRLTGYCVIFERGTFDEYLQESSGEQPSLLRSQLTPSRSTSSTSEARIVSKRSNDDESSELFKDLEFPPQGHEDI